MFVDDLVISAFVSFIVVITMQLFRWVFLSVLATLLTRVLKLSASPAPDLLGLLTLVASAV